MSQNGDLVTRPWVVAIALACFVAGVFIQQLFFAITLGPLINSNPNGNNGDGNGNGNQTTTIPITTTTPATVSHFQIIPDPQTGFNYKKRLL